MYDDPDWSLFVSIAWCMFRTKKSVDYFAQLKNPSDTHLVVWQQVNDNKNYMDVDLAIRHLKNSLKLGKLTSSGLNMDTDKREEIIYSDWIDLELYLTNKYPNDAYNIHSKILKPEWHQIYFPKSEIQKIFPSKTTKRKQAKKSTPTSVILPKHRSWARKYYAQLKKHGVRSNRDEDEAAFRAEFPNLTRALARELRKEFVQERAKGGRPPKQ